MPTHKEAPASVAMRLPGNRFVSKADWLWVKISLCGTGFLGLISLLINGSL
jgi:hypothetical protein